MEPWKRQFIRYLFPYSLARQKIELAFIVKHPHVPNYLYKYREFNPRHLAALREGVLWMSSPDRFNDPFDTTIFFDSNRFIVEDESPEEAIESAKELQRVTSAGGLFKPKPLTRLLTRSQRLCGSITPMSTLAFALNMILVGLMLKSCAGCVFRLFIDPSAPMLLALCPRRFGEISISFSGSTSASLKRTTGLTKKSGASCCHWANPWQIVSNRCLDRVLLFSECS